MLDQYPSPRAEDLGLTRWNAHTPTVLRGARIGRRRVWAAAVVTAEECVEKGVDHGVEKLKTSRRKFPPRRVRKQMKGTRISKRQKPACHGKAQLLKSAYTTKITVRALSAIVSDGTRLLETLDCRSRSWSQFPINLTLSHCQPPFPVFIHFPSRRRNAWKRLMGSHQRFLCVDVKTNA